MMSALKEMQEKGDKIMVEVRGRQQQLVNTTSKLEEASGRLEQLRNLTTEEESRLEGVRTRVQKLQVCIIRQTRVTVVAGGGGGGGAAAPAGGGAARSGGGGAGQPDEQEGQLADGGGGATAGGGTAGGRTVAPGRAWGRGAGQAQVSRTIIVIIFCLFVERRARTELNTLESAVSDRRTELAGLESNVARQTELLQ